MHCRVFLAWFALWVWFSMAMQSMAANEPADLYITRVAAVDLEKGKIQRDRTVFIRNGRIKAIEDANSFAVPLGAAQLDGRAKFLIPGLWDMHAHLADHGEVDLAMLVETEIADAMDRPGDAVHILEEVEKIFSNEYIQNLLKKYRTQRAEQD